MLHPLALPSPAQRPNESEAAALRALAAARARTKKDCLPCRVAEGLFIGGAGAARNLKALRKRGITAVVNAAPSVPCHFKDCPEDEFTYLALPLFDDPDAGGCCAGSSIHMHPLHRWQLAKPSAGLGDLVLLGAAGAAFMSSGVDCLPRLPRPGCGCLSSEHPRPPQALCGPSCLDACMLTAERPPVPARPADLAPHVEAANAVIAAARARGAGVLVHCYAGQSRSAALVIAFLMASQGMGLMQAWAATRAARPCAQPNAGGCYLMEGAVGCRGQCPRSLPAGSH